MDSIRTAHNEVCVLIRKEVGSAETDLHVYSSKKGHISDTQASQQPSHSSSSSVSSTTSAASTTNQLNSNRDSMSNMGNFNLADYLPTHQVSVFDEFPTMYYCIQYIMIHFSILS